MRQHIWRRRCAASTAEYGLFVGLIAVFLLSVLSATGQNLSHLFGHVANNVNNVQAGQDPVAEIEMVLMPNGVAVPALPEQDENCAKGNVTEAAASILNDSFRRSWGAAIWCSQTNLDLTSRGLVSIPPEVGLLTNLKNLDLGQNNLVTLPKEISYLSNLKELKLIDNQLTSLPEEIGHLQALQALDIRENNLTILPESYAALSSLTSINARNNRSLRQLPEQLGQMNGVKSIYVSGGDLQSLPASIVDLPRLNDIYVGGNSDLVLTAEQCTFFQNLSGVFSVNAGVCP